MTTSNVMPLTKKPKYRVIFEKLQAKIAEGYYKVGDSLPTQQQMMEKYGVSLSTIRQSLSELEKEGWVKAQHGRGCFVLSKSDSKVEKLQQTGLGCAILSERLDHPGYMVILRNAARHLMQNGYELSLGIFDPNIKAEVNSLLIYINGLKKVVITGAVSLDLLKNIPEKAYSKIVFATHFLGKECYDFAEAKGLSTLNTDAISAGYMASQMLLLAGHKNIGCVVSSSGTYSEDIREGFMRCCIEAGIESPPTFQICSIAEELIAMDKISSMKEITGLVVQGDLNACRFVHRFIEPSKTKSSTLNSVVGIDGAPKSNLDVQDLSRVNINLEMLGVDAAKAILTDNTRICKVLPVRVEAGKTVVRLT